MNQENRWFLSQNENLASCLLFRVLDKFQLRFIFSLTGIFRGGGGDFLLFQIRSRIEEIVAQLVSSRYHMGT